jgi:zinc protease
MKRKITSSIFLLTALLFVVNTLSAQINLNDKIPQDPNVKIGKLSNGLTYFIRKNNKPEKKIELRLVINAGSILEDEDQQGLAHFIEHMSFNGSKNFKKNDLVSYLQSIGVEFGADLNASTGFDETVYILPIPSDKKEIVEKGFQILEDWASTVSFDTIEVDKERGVVLEESRLGKGADDRMQKIYFPKILEGSLYAERLPIGKDEILQHFKHDVIRQFYKDWYRPNLMAVIVVGDIDPVEAEKLIISHFELLKNPAKEKTRTSPDVPSRKKSEGVVATDKEATNHILQIYYATQKSKVEVTLGDYREHLIKSYCTSMLNQRFRELTQNPNPPFLNAGSSLSDFLRGYEAYSSWAVISKAGIEPAMNAIIEENERARKFGFTSAELDRTKKNYLRSVERAYNERDKTESSSYVSEYISAFLEHESIPGIENEYTYHKKFSENITLQEVNEYAARIIPDISKNKLVLLTGPDKAEFKIPTGNELLAMADTATKTEVKPYEEKLVSTSLIEKKPSPGKIIAENEIKELNITEITLSNGIKVILKPSDFKNDEVVMTATRFGGGYLYNDDDHYNAEYSATCITQMGIAQFTPFDLKKVLAGKSVFATPRVGDISEGFIGQCGAKDVETMFQLVYLYATQPRKDQSLFDSFISKQQARYQNIMSDPYVVFQDTLLQATYKNHPRAPKVLTPEDFTKINLDRAMQIYNERFQDMNEFTFILAGSFNVNSIKPLLTLYLGSLPSTKKKHHFRDIGLRPTKGIVTKKVFKGTESKSYIVITFQGESPYSANEKLKLGALVELLKIKIIETLREDMSSVYGAGVQGALAKNPYNNYNISISIPCGPENVDKLLKACFNEIQKIKDNGAIESDLNKVKETWKKQFDESVKDNNYWAQAIQSAIENGTPAANILTFKSRVDALTSADIKAAANRYFDMKNYIQGILYPEIKK